MPEIIMERVLKWQIMPRIMMLAVTILHIKQFIGS